MTTAVVAAMRRRLHTVNVQIAQHYDRGETPPQALTDEAVQIEAALSRAAAEAGQDAGWHQTGHR